MSAEPADLPPPTTKAPGGPRRAPMAARPPQVPARPHRSRTVGVLKAGLPAGALILVGLMVGWSQFETQDSGVQLTFAQPGEVAGSELGMRNARYVASDQNDQPYVITAQDASHTEAEPTLVDLTDMQADILMNEGHWVMISAAEGMFDRLGQVLLLDGGINIFSDRGYEFRTESALIDLSQGIATSETEIDGQGPFGVIRADRFRVTDRGQHMYFNGNVRMTLYPASMREVQAEDDR